MSVELSGRLRAVANLVSAGSIVCDVGCDHGYVPIHLVRSGICPRAIATDVNAGPLLAAAEHVRALGLEKYIETRRSDGLSAVAAGEADALILAGMGGRLVIKILTAGEEKARMMGELILQPQSELALVRKFLRGHGFRTRMEDMVYEDGKYYTAIKVTYMSENRTALGQGQDRQPGGPLPGEGAPGPCPERQEAFDRYGEWLLRARHPVLLRYLMWERERDEAVRRQLAGAGEGSGEAAFRRRRRAGELERAALVREWALSCFAEN